ncbi:hypothetical protein AVEN_224993-1 [Araneus ventricosus]|uniref:Uncharacterized protein n=1 Tax=Araneus ventricosus TaxID=182803 RepID=A0A4Y2S6F6_ARAVE|nr:hypothetical protein AVEN_224993-1 [Araneus ventricosus]
MNLTESLSKLLMYQKLSDNATQRPIRRFNQNGNIINDCICNNNSILLAPPEPTHFLQWQQSTLDFGVLKQLLSGDATSLNEILQRS